MSIHKDISKGLSKHIIWLSFFVTAIFFIILCRLWFLQIIDTDKLQAMSENNRFRFIPVAAPRGTILDRNGNVLVNNIPSFSLAVIPNDVKDKDSLIDTLSKLLDIDKEELLARWDMGKGRAKYMPVVLASDITRDQVEYFAANSIRFPGLDIELKPIRQYPYGDLASHLLGYIGEISDKELASGSFSSYGIGDYVGKSGIEKSYESYLYGMDGGKRIEVDARGRYLDTVSEDMPTTGDSVQLTIDVNLQKAAEKALGDRAGAAVVIDVKTGEILAFASTPVFDPSLFIGKMPPDKWKEYLNDKRHPLEDKALKGQYPPGSTFKIVTAMAGLSEGLINANTSVDCTGAYTVGSQKFHCWDKHGHGITNLRKALKESCDVYFYKLGDRLGVDKIAEYAHKFGLGEPMGVGLENEKSGLIPTAEWKLQKTGKSWYRGETIPVAIGQGYVTMTPIQLAAMISCIANDGILYQPHLVKRILDPDGKTIKEFTPTIFKNTGFKPEYIQLIKDGLRAVVNEPGGTGKGARISGITVAGKTGTSQVVKIGARKGDIPYKYRDHALFVGFAPYEKPEVAIAVVVEHGVHGGSAAAPVAAQVLRSYFEGKHPSKPHQNRVIKEKEEDSAPTVKEGEDSVPTGEEEE